MLFYMLCIYMFFWGFLLKKIVMGLWILVIGLVQNLVVHFSEYSFDFSLITIEKWSKNFIFNFFLSMTFFFVKMIKWNGKSCIFQQKNEHIRHFLSAGGDYIWISRCLFIYVLLLNDVERTKSHVVYSTRYNARKEDQRLFYNKNSTAITFLVLERTFTKIACSIINERGASV